jgi:hypothetical protein
LSDLAAIRTPKDPNASEFRSEYDGILQTRTAFHSKKLGMSPISGPGTLAKTLDVLATSIHLDAACSGSKPNFLP